MCLSVCLSNLIGLERWLQVLAALQKTPIPFPEHSFGRSQLPIPPTPGDLTYSSGLPGYLHTCGICSH